MAELLRGHEALDELITVPRHWLKSPRVFWRLWRRLRAMNFDLVIDSQSLAKSAVAGWLSGAKRRIGLCGRLGREFSTWLNTELVDGDDMHAVQRNLRLLRPLGIESPTVRFGVPSFPKDWAAVEAMLDATCVTDGFALVVPAAGWPSKLWPAQRYAAVAAHLGRVWRLPSMIVWGNDEEHARAERIAAGSEGAAILAPKLRLLELAELARRARLCLGSDTGPLHLAAAVGTPCVGLYGAWPADQYGPYGPEHVCVQKMCCQGSTRHRRHAGPTYMEAIDDASVRAACDQVLARTGGGFGLPGPGFGLQRRAG